jgi:hypothetical protein
MIHAGYTNYDETELLIETLSSNGVYSFQVNGKDVFAVKLLYWPTQQHFLVGLR